MYKIKVGDFVSVVREFLDEINGNDADFLFGSALAAPFVFQRRQRPE